MTDPLWSRGFHVKHFGSKRRRKLLGGPADSEKTSMNFPNTSPAPVHSGPADGPNPASATALLGREEQAARVEVLSATNLPTDRDEFGDVGAPSVPEHPEETGLQKAANGSESGTNVEKATGTGDVGGADDVTDDESTTGVDKAENTEDVGITEDAGTTGDAEKAGGADNTSDPQNTTDTDIESAADAAHAGRAEEEREDQGDSSTAADTESFTGTLGDLGDSTEVSDSGVDISTAAANADSVEPRDDIEDTPLAREIADLTRRRSALAAEQLPLPASTRIFTVANQKGGVGKTTTTVNLAAALARGGSRVLVIDLDPQGNASTALGVDHRADTPSVYDVIIDDEPMADIVQKSPEFDGLYCLPSTIHLAGAEIELVSMVAREQRLRTSLMRFLADTPERFHYVFIDCPPSLGLLTINAFVAASEVLIPIQCEYYALEGLSQLLNNISLIERHLNPTLTVSTILLTMFDSRTNLANQVAQDVRDHFPDQVLPTPIPRSVRISEAPSYGQTVISYDTNSAGSLSYREAAAEIARRGAPN